MGAAGLRESAGIATYAASLAETKPLEPLTVVLVLFVVVLDLAKAKK